MAKKNNKSSWLMTIPKLLSALLLFLNLWNNIISLIKREIEQAKKNIILFVILFLFLLIFIISVWFSLLGMLFYYFISLKFSELVSVFFIFFINILLLIVTGMIMLNVRKKIFFPECRRLLMKHKDVND